MLHHGRGYLYYNTLYAIIPSVAIFVTVLSLNIVGDSLRDRLAPRDAGLIKEDNARSLVRIVHGSRVPRSRDPSVAVFHHSGSQIS